MPLYFVGFSFVCDSQMCVIPVVHFFVIEIMSIGQNKTINILVTTGTSIRERTLKCQGIRQASKCLDTPPFSHIAQHPNISLVYSNCQITRLQYYNNTTATKTNEIRRRFVSSVAIDWLGPGNPNLTWVDLCFLCYKNVQGDPFSVR